MRLWNFREKSIINHLTNYVDASWEDIAEMLAVLGWSYTDDDYNEGRPVDIVELADCVIDAFALVHYMTD